MSLLQEGNSEWKLDNLPELNGALKDTHWNKNKSTKLQTHSNADHMLGGKQTQRYKAWYPTTHFGP